MKITILINQKVLQPLLDTYLDSGITSSSPYEEYKKIAQKVVENIEPDLKEKIFSTRADLNLEEKDFDFSNMSESGKFDIILGFINFLITIKNVIDGYEPMFLNFKGLTRQICPPLEVYKYVGHSELDIKPSKISYSLLFD